MHTTVFVRNQYTNAYNNAYYARYEKINWNLFTREVQNIYWLGFKIANSYLITTDNPKRTNVFNSLISGTI
jgi:hypothetical protein